MWTGVDNGVGTVNRKGRGEDADGGEEGRVWGEAVKR